MTDNNSNDILPMGLRLGLALFFFLGCAAGYGIIVASGNSIGGESSEAEVSAASAKQGPLSREEVQKIARAEAETVARSTAKSVADTVAREVASEVARDVAQSIAQDAARQAIASAD